MPAWVTPQNPGTDPQRLKHLFPNHTLAQALKAHEATLCNLYAEQLLLGTPSQGAGKPTNAGGQLCLGCALR